MSTGITTPEDILGGRDQASLSIRLKCNRCGRGYSGKFAWVCYNPKRVPEHPEWDGLLLSRTVECAGCGAIDDYTLTPQTKLRLMGGALGRMDGSREAPVIVGVSTLWDGSIARRPSQALERLRELVAENPDRAEAHRRLGNACERWGLREEAVSAWSRAFELDPQDLEAAYSLAHHWWGEGQRPARGFDYLRRALQAIPKIAAKGQAGTSNKGTWTAQLVWLLRDVVEGSADPIALAAAWSVGEKNGEPVVSLSSVDLSKVDNFGRLADFVGSDDVLALDLTLELPEEEPTILQRLLAGEDFDPAGADGSAEQALAAPVRAAPKVGRNAPCPCGSGKKHKRCCGG